MFVYKEIHTGDTTSLSSEPQGVPRSPCSSDNPMHQQSFKDKVFGAYAPTSANNHIIARMDRPATRSRVIKRKSRRLSLFLYTPTLNPSSRPVHPDPYLPYPDRYPVPFHLVHLVHPAFHPWRRSPRPVPFARHPRPRPCGRPVRLGSWPGSTRMPFPPRLSGQCHTTGYYQSS